MIEGTTLIPIDQLINSCQLLTLQILERSSGEEDENDPVNVQSQDAVIVDFVGRVAAGTTAVDGPVFHEAKDWLLVIGEKDVVPALEMGIRFMGQGQTAAVWSHSKYAYGPGVRSWNDSNLPPHSAVLYTVTLKRVLPAENLLQRSFQLKLCQSKKTIANDIYNNDDVINDHYAKSRALHIYNRAAEMLDHMLLQSADGTADDGFDPLAARECLLDCLNNIAAVHLRCRSYHAAKEACVAVLEKDSHNFKALLRAAKAALLDPASSYEEVDAAISAAAEQCDTSPETGLSKEVERLRSDFTRRRVAHQKREKQMYSKMAKANLNITESRIPPENDNFGNNIGDDGKTHESQKGDAEQGAGVVPDDHSFASLMKKISWKDIFIRYGIQLLLPFVMAYYLAIVRNRRHQHEEEAS